MSHDVSHDKSHKPGARAAGKRTTQRSTVGKRSAVATRHPRLDAALAKHGGGGDRPTVSDAAGAAVASKGSGTAVDSKVASRVGAHLGTDLSGVRVHQDQLSGEAAHAMGARAFAYGADVFLASAEQPSDMGLMAHELTHVVQQGAAGTNNAQQLNVGDANTPAEAEADAVAAAVVGGQKPASLVAEDGVAELAPGQMHKTEFLARLRPAVIMAANEELGPVWSAVGCPYIERYFAMYQGKSAKHIDAVIRKYAPAANGVTSAAGYIPVILIQVRQAVIQWVETGQLTGRARDIAPPDVAASAATAHGDDSVQAKPEPAATTRPLQVQLGDGAPLAGTTTSAIADVYGEDFASVRVHTDDKAARMARDHSAKAVTAGDDIAFAKGAYQPGSLEGDALLAHELAHVVQQRGAPALQLKRKRGEGEGEEEGEVVVELPTPQNDAHENDADQAAAGALAKIYGGAKTALGSAADRVGPALKSGFGLARCSSDPDPAKIKKKAKKKAKSTSGGTDFMKDTHAPTAGEKTEVSKILDPIGSAPAASKPFKAAYFRAHFKKALLKWINSTTRHNKKMLGPAGFDLAMPQVRKTGEAAQSVVSARYGAFVKNATLHAGTSARKPGYDVGSPAVLHTQQESIDGVGSADKQLIVRGLIDYAAAQDDGGKPVKLKANFDSSRPADRLAYRRVRNGLMANRAIFNKLVQIQRNWPGEEHPWDGTVYIQLRQMTDKKLAKKEKGGDAAFKDGNLRKGYWGSFQTLIHEYLHSCAHGNLQDAAHSGPGMSHQILIEGGCDYYTEKIWNDTAPKVAGDDALRLKVEGKKYPYNAAVIPAPSYYSEKEDVKKIISKLGAGGEANFNAAYFLGHTEMIGLGKWKPGMISDEGIYIAPIDKFDLKTIAERCFVDESTVAKANSLKIGASVAKGTPVKVPGIKWHSCIGGDNKADIAKQHAVKGDALDKANPFVTWNSLLAGQKILIPVRR